MGKFFLPLLLITIIITGEGCYDCGPQAEPSISLNVTLFDTTYTLQKVSALGLKSDSAFRAFSTNKYGGGGMLPMSLLQDSTTYLFYFADRVDTLTLFYERIFDARRECGYYVDIAAPKGRHYHSTFRSTEVRYAPYIGEIKGLSGSTAYGISVSVSR